MSAASGLEYCNSVKRRKEIQRRMKALAQELVRLKIKEKTAEKMIQEVFNLHGQWDSEVNHL